MPNDFKTYIGIVVEDKQLQSREIKVYIRDMTPYSAGNLGDNTRQEQYTITNETGEKVSSNVNTTNSVTADYFGLYSNRAFPPDVVKGEQVLVLQFADEDKYYWVPMGRDDNLRKGELIRFAASDDMSPSKQLTEANTYFVELDTKLAKRIRLHTSKSNGEAFGYDVIIDAMNSFIQIADDQGNRIELVSPESKIKLTNNSGTTVNIEKENITVLAPSEITVRAGSTLNVIAPTININGSNINSTGAVSSSGSMTNNGNLTNNGNISNSGTITSAGAVTAPNI